MAYNSVSGSLFKKMVTNGAINLKNNYAEVDSLNVFPVPDGDTGTNMSMTMMSGINEIENYDSNSLVDISKVLSRGFLMGARGNSGVILSQFFRGVSLGMRNVQSGSASIEEFVDVLVSGNRAAYQAVMSPVEGTILTVMREAGEEIDAHRSEYKTVDELLKCYLKKAQQSLANTPNILPVLKDAGVVDSGGAGFVKVVEGMYLASIGKMLEMIEESEEGSEKEEKFVQEEPQETPSKYLYNIELEIMLKDKDNFVEADLRSPLSISCDSLTIETKKGICSVKLATNNPGRALNMSQRHGEFKLVKIVNNKLPKEEVQEPQEATEYGIITVCRGAGIKETFENLGASYIIDGGQSMNPSTEDFVKAIKASNAKQILIIPNNSNVIMSANQAKELCSDKCVEVVKTKNFAQGFSALANFDPEASLEDNLEAMQAAISNAKAIEITYAVRDTEVNGVKIQVGDTLGILDDQIIASTKERFAAIKKALTRSVSKDSFVVTVFKGLEGDDEEVAKMEEYVNVLNEDCDFEVIEGGQDVYSYIICVE